MTGDAVKVTLSPSQTVVADAAMEMLTAKGGFTVRVMALLVAGEPMLQAALEVS